jgi:acyl-CoA reductase-like NAD-dependent aldehyde dehydrogenase
VPVAPANVAALPKPGFLIGGEKITSGEGGVHEHRYAATGELTYKVPMGSAQDMDKAVKAARAAFKTWSKLPANQRRIHLLKFAQAIRERSDALGRMMTAENSVLSSSTAWSTNWVAELFEYNAGWADKIGGEVVTTFPGPAFDYTLDEPYGVIAVIVPWNGPFVSFGQTLAPALAAGNTVVIKPPELAPYSCLMLAELALEAGIPPGVINVVPAGPEGGDALVRHKGVDKIHFTGSGATARKIVSASLENLTPYGLELGGKSARLVFDDADIPGAVQRAIGSAVGGSGQACICASRVLIQQSIYDKFVADAKLALEKIQIGDPTLPTTNMGPVINQGAVDRILGFIDRAQNDGLRLVTGGKRLGGELAGGYFIEPTIFADVSNDAHLARNEVFGPILAFMPFKDEEDAIRIANDTDFGLAGWIESENVKRVHRVAAALEAGTVWVNGFYDLPVGAPFGGYKQSGVGRVGGKWGIHEFTRPKNVWMQL